MVVLNEDVSCYASTEQRELLIQITSNAEIFKNYFLTGGTALSVFYLHHRSSEDLDLFTLGNINISEVVLWIRTKWPNNHTIIRSSTHFLSMLVNDVKVDFVHDPLSIQGDREVYSWDTDSMLKIDTVLNIASNKLCTLVSRFEPKDFIDFYFLFYRITELKINEILDLAREKEKLFDDPPTAAYQIEEGIRFFREQEELMPPLKEDLNMALLYQFFDELANKLYKMITPKRE